jgi:hypothetical protein
MRSLADLVDYSLEAVRSSRDLLEDTIPYPRSASGPCRVGQGELSGRSGIGKPRSNLSGGASKAGVRVG